MDKQTAVDLLDNLLGMVEDNHDSDYDTAIHMGIDALKSNTSNVLSALDCVDRQAAIDALRNRWLKTKNYEGIGEDIAEECEIYLRTVPSAQPEIIRCKDCKYWMRAYLSISGKHGCNVMRDYTAPDDYCFKAERKA